MIIFISRLNQGMNPLTNVKNISKLSETELRLGLSGKASWHSMYSHSAWIFVGGLNFELTEGDILCVFSQYGEIAEINLVKDKDTGKSKGFCFICYEDQRSTTLAVDNLNGIKLVGRIIRVDHCGNYETPEEREKKRQKERKDHGGRYKADDSDDDVIVDKESKIKTETDNENRSKRNRDKFESSRSHNRYHSDHHEFDSRKVKKESEDANVVYKNSKDETNRERPHSDNYRRDYDRRSYDDKNHYRSQDVNRKEVYNQSRNYESHRNNDRYDDNRKDFSSRSKDETRSRFKNDRYTKEDTHRHREDRPQYDKEKHREERRRYDDHDKYRNDDYYEKKKSKYDSRRDDKYL